MVLKGLLALGSGKGHWANNGNVSFTRTSSFPKVARSSKPQFARVAYFHNGYWMERPGRQSFAAHLGENYMERVGVLVAHVSKAQTEEWAIRRAVFLVDLTQHIFGDC